MTENELKEELRRQAVAAIRNTRAWLIDMAGAPLYRPIRTPPDERSIDVPLDGARDPDGAA